MKIGSKMILIISAIVVVALSGMILLATYFFRNDNETRVRETNLKIAEVVALKTKTEFSTIAEKMNFMAEIMDSSLASYERSRFADLFFNNDRDFIFIGVASRSYSGTRVSQYIANREFTGAQDIEPRTLAGFTERNIERFDVSFSGEMAVENVSDLFGMPVIGVSIPYRSGSVIVAYLTLSRFVDVVRAAGITRVFIVNAAGDLIAHPNAANVLARVNYRTLPIVNTMLKSRFDNRHMRYRDEKKIDYIGAFKKIDLGGLGIIAAAPEYKAFEEVYNIQRRNLLIMGIVLTLAVLVVFLFSRTLTRPIVDLVAATKEIEAGNFRVLISSRSRDEIGELTRSFVHMGAGLEERERFKDAFGKFVNTEIAERVARGDIKLGGERKRAAIFFSDIRSFTALSETLTPEEVVEFLNEYMGLMVACVTGTHGVVDKFIGDAIMAVWGAPVSSGDDTGNAVECALSMRASLAAFNRSREADGKPRVKIGIGINTGDVLAGQIGSERRIEYTVIGDPVNLASRVESLNKPFGTDILITEESWKLVEGRFTVAPMQRIMVKGKSDPQQLYAVLGRAGDTSAPADIDALRAMLGTVAATGPVHADEEKYELLP